MQNHVYKRMIYDIAIMIKTWRSINMKQKQMT